MDILIISGFVIVIVCICFNVFRDFGAKKSFDVPWYYRVISLDIGGKKGRFYAYKNVIGVPDAVFKHPLWPKYIIGEVKGRQYRDTIRDYEYYQTQLYMGIISSKTIGSVSGKLKYKDHCTVVPFEKTLFTDIVSKRTDAIHLLNQL